MAYRRSYSRYNNRGSKNHAAIKHAREGREFSWSVGGTDKDVKSYFFNLPKHRFDAVLTLYGKAHGKSAESYARGNYTKWLNGSRQMSGMVAKRLFDLLPPLMPTADKLKLVESLWKHTQPSSSHTITVTKENSYEDIQSKVNSHFESVLSVHTIPENFERRFNWLAGDDSNVRQQLENHFVAMQRELHSHSSGPIIATFLNKLKSMEVGFTGTHDIQEASPESLK